MMTWQKALAAVAMSTVVVGLPAMTANAASPIVPYGAIRAEWLAKGGASGFLGAPTSNEYSIPGGDPASRMETFTGGNIYWSSATGAHEVHGAILGEYARAFGTSAYYGVPLTDESPTWDGVGRYNHFQSGRSIYWTPSTGAHTVYGAIRDDWASLGWERSAIGYPTSDEIDVNGVPGAQWQSFSAGNMYWSPTSGAHEVHGAILTEYLDVVGGPQSYGLPLTDETTTPDGIGRFNHFSAGGSIYWTPATGAHAVYGAIREDWSAGGWERGPIGYPTTDEFDLSVPYTPGVRLQDFTRGVELWSPTTGAHEVHGAILTEYIGLGGPGSVVGMPRTDETTTPDGVGRFNHFQAASIYWTPATGAHEVHGLIRSTWAESGWELGPLGYPVADESDAAGGRARSYFQHGYIEVVDGVASIHLILT